MQPKASKRTMKRVHTSDDSILCRYEDGYTPEEIAAQLHVSVKHVRNTIATHIRRCA